jgi:uncharacterized protein YdbL (DUF1318 family)
MAMNRTFVRTLMGGLALAGVALSTPAAAQRDPAYQAARAAGQLGEKMDGYIGVVGSQPAAIEQIANDINIRRRENYAQRAQAQGVTLQEFAVAQGCVLIARTEPGEKYQAPDGSWQTRGSGPPQLHSRCPA